MKGTLFPNLKISERLSQTKFLIFRFSFYKCLLAIWKVTLVKPRWWSASLSGDDFEAPTRVHIHIDIHRRTTSLVKLVFHEIINWDYITKTSRGFLCGWEVQLKRFIQVKYLHKLSWFIMIYSINLYWHIYSDLSQAVQCVCRPFIHKEPGQTFPYLTGTKYTVMQSSGGFPRFFALQPTLAIRMHHYSLFGVTLLEITYYFVSWSDRINKIGKFGPSFVKIPVQSLSDFSNAAHKEMKGIVMHFPSPPLPEWYDVSDTTIRRFAPFLHGDRVRAQESFWTELTLTSQHTQWRTGALTQWITLHHLHGSNTSFFHIQESICLVFYFSKSWVWIHFSCGWIPDSTWFFSLSAQNHRVIYHLHNICPKK